MLLEEQLQAAGKSLHDFHLHPPFQLIDVVVSTERRLILEELSFDRTALQFLPTLNPEQRTAFDVGTTAALQNEA